MAQNRRADLIVTGRVSAVRLPSGGGRGPGDRGRQRPDFRAHQRHAPVWHEAVIDVDEVHKGTHTTKQIVVRFPSSTDVRWYNAPKFHTGQEGVFLLHKEQLAGTRAMAAGQGAGPASTPP